MSTWISQGVLKGADGATGPAGGVFGSAIADFGSADNGGADAMSVVVTVAASWVTSTSYPIVEIGPGGDHTDADDLTSEEVYALVTNIVIGVSFDIEVFAPNGTWGQWLVNWGAALTGSNDPTKASTSTLISAGDGLSGGGSLAANRTLAVDGTVIRSGDSRLTDSRIALPSGGTTHYYDYDDFIGPAKFCIAGNGGGTGAVSASYPTTLGVGHAGAYQLSPGTTVQLSAWLYTGPVFLAEFNTIIWRALVCPVNAIAGAATQHFCGLANTLTTVLSASNWYIGFYYIPASGTTWHAYVRNAGSVTDQDTGIPANAAWVDLKIVATSTSIAFYVNGALTNTITTNIPAGTQQLFPSCFINASTSTSGYTFLVDTVEIDIDYGVAGRFIKAAI